MKLIADHGETCKTKENIDASHGSVIYSGEEK